MRSVHITIKDNATGVEARFHTSVELPRGALLFDVQKAALEKAVARFFRPEYRESFLKSRRTKIKKVP